MKIFKAETIKRYVTLSNYLSRAGIETKPVGGHTVNAIQCPLCGHKDCFRGELDKDLWKCFSCNKGGDVMTLHGLIHNLPFMESCQGIGEMFNLEPETATGPASSTKPGPKPEALAILEAATRHYEAAAKVSDRFLRYAALRHLDKELIQQYRLGFADGTLFETLKAHYPEGDIIDAGLARKDEKTGRIYDFFKDQVIFPYLDADNRVIHLKGKGINRMGKSSGKVYQLPLNNRERPFFGCQFRPNGILYLVEGEMDAVACRKLDFCAWAMGGNPPESQMQEIRRMLDKGQKIVLVPDNDDGGEKYAKRFREDLFHFALPASLRKTLHFKGEVVQGTFPTTYKDIDEAIRDPALAMAAIQERPLYPSLKQCLDTYYSYLNSESEDGIRYSVDLVARVIYEYLSGFGQFFVVDSDCYLIFRGKQYHIENNMPFKALLYHLAAINYASNQSKAIWEALKAQCYIKAQHSHGISWISCNHNAGCIHYNLCNPKNELICIEPGRIAIEPNGSNPHGVFLFQSPKTLPIEYLPDQDMETGLDLLLNIFCGYTATEPQWQAYIIAMIINTFIIEFAKARGINKFSGHQGSGKTEAAGLITALIYGQNFVTISSTASDYTDAAVNPITVCDNLEISSIVEDRKNFLLCVATGITRQKRKSGTDNQNVYEKAVTQLITTSIESFELPELIERTIVIPFSSKHFSANYPGAVSIENNVITRRNEILSAIFQLVARILTDLDDQKAHYTTWLQQHFPNHAKKRLNEHLACMALALSAFMTACPKARARFKSPEHIITAWISEQDRENDETMQDTSVIVRFLNMLESEWRRDALTNYGLDPDQALADAKEGLQFETSNEQLLTAFNLAAKKFNLPQPFKSVRHMAVRIKNEQATLEKAGWTIFKSRTIRGKRLYVFANYNMEN